MTEERVHRVSVQYTRKRAMCVFALLLALTIVSCRPFTPATHIAAFSEATASLANQATQAYEQVNESTIQRRIVDVAADPINPPKDETFKGLIIDENLRVRMRLLQLLGAYANAMGDLANADFRKDIDKAATDLYGVLGDLKKTYNKATGKDLSISDNSFALIATAVDAIGTAIVEQKRRAAIKRIVIESNDSIQQVSMLLKQELPGFADFAKANIETVETEMIKAYQTEAARLSFSQRIVRLQEIRQQNQAKLAAPRFFGDLGTAAEKIGTAHKVLFDAVSQDKFTTGELIKSIREMAEFAKSLQELHKMLTSAKAN